MKKILPLLLLCIFITGCTPDYELKVNKYSIEDKATLNIKNNDYEKAILINELFQISNGEYTTDQEIGTKVINRLRTSNLSPGYKIDGFYTKDIQNNKIELSYLYKNDTFQNSYIFNTCFDDFYYNSTNDYYIINGSGSFKCLINKKVKIAIKSDYLVIDSNADKVNGNTYIWNFNTKNNLDHELYIQISKKYKAPKNNNNNLIVIIAILISGILFYKFIIKKEKITLNHNNDV